MTPLSNDLVFGFDVLSNTAGGISQHCAVDVDGIVFWMSNARDFYFYDGRVQKLPCTVRDFIFGNGGNNDGDINLDQKEKIFAGVDTSYDEIIWLYQSINATNGDCDRYVKYNYRESSWDIGTVERTVWADATLFDNPTTIDIQGNPFSHNVGTNDASDNLGSYAESSWFDIKEGTEMLLIDQMLPDFIQTKNLNFTITTRKGPNGVEVTKGPFVIEPTTQVINFRARGRQAKIRFSTSATDSFWEMGKPQIRVKTDGQR